MSLSANTPQLFRWVLNAALGIVFSLELLVPNLSPLLYPALMVLAAAASVAALHRQLPLQNVLLAAAITALIGGIAFGLSALPDLSIPFGPISFNPSSGQKIFNSIPWTIPLLWIVVIFNARGVVRLMLRPWRKTKNYGWWVIGLTALLASAFDFALEPFAVRVKHLWIWRPTRIPFTWQGASPMAFLGWFFVALLVLAFITPSLIKKQPGSSGKSSDLQPLFVWLGALLLFAVGPAIAGNWLPVGIDAGIAAVTLVLSVRGAKW
jgi:uncharacterized membrane protein